MKKIFWGILARIINLFVGTKIRHWVFASDFGNMYRESAKYLFEYMQKEHKEFTCTYVVAKKEVYNEIKSKGFPVVNNYSIKGIIAIAKADKVFTTQTSIDMLYAYKKKNRKYYYLNHGQSLKKQMKALSKEFREIPSSNKKVLNIKKKVYKFLLSGYAISDSEFVSANSEFFIPFLKKSYGENMPIRILGMPRNDALFRHEEMAKEKWFNNLHGKFIITYMPTHRKYGRGNLTPTPFINMPEVQEWLKKHNCVLLMKQHPNMIPKLSEIQQSDVIMDITKEKIDPQVIIYHSDILISDYSSVWLDYLLLRRPLVTYIYDDFEKNDAGLNIDIKKDGPGLLCYSENELFRTLVSIKKNYQGMCPTEDVIRKFYLDADGRASERYFNQLNLDYLDL